MANYKEHASTGGEIGALAAFFIDLHNQNKGIETGEQRGIDLGKTAGRTILGYIAGTVCGVLPDILEPATSPNHRKFFHSLAAVSALTYGLSKTHQSNLDLDTKRAVFCGIASYISHLALDMKTAKGLPLI